MKKNKLFLCFRPLPTETEHRRYNAAAVRRSDPNDGSTNTIFSKEQNPVLSNVKSSVINLDNRRIRKSRSVSRILKNILFEASLKNRVGDKEGDKLFRRSKTDGSTKLSEWVKKSDDEFVKQTFSRTNSNSIIVNQCESFNDEKQSNYTISNSVTRRNSSSSCCSGMYLILITVIITILCGRVYAILLMCLWIYCTPRGRRNGREKVEYEKRMVIMEGH